jgi:hypothetical protein
MKGFTLEVETLFRAYLSSHCSGVTEICNEALTADVSFTVQVMLKSISYEVDFTLEAETVFPPYLPSHCCGVTEILRFGTPCACAMSSAS